MTLNAELAQLGFPIDDNATADNLARWVAKAALDLTLDPKVPNRASDESGYTYRIIRTLESPEEGCVLSVPLADRVDFFIGIRLDRHFRVHGVIRASYESLAAAGTPRGGEVLLRWEAVETQGTGIEILYNDSVTHAETATEAVGATTRP